MGEVKEAIKSPLQDRTLFVQPIERKEGWLPVGHDGKFMYTGTKRRYPVSYNNQKRQYEDPLTLEERLWFESDESGMSLKPGDLSVYKRENNFWNSFEVVLEKTGLTLDLNNPMDYLRYKVLLTQKLEIAPSYKQKDEKKSYKFCLVDLAEKEQANAQKVDYKKECYKEFGKMEDSADKMFGFLKVYSMTNQIPGNKKVDKNTSKSALVNLIDEIIIRDPNTFLEISRDPDFALAATVQSALQLKHIEFDDGSYKIGTIKIGESVPEIINYLKNPKNQKQYIELKNKLN